MAVRLNNKARRTMVIERLGGKCVRCGFSDLRALQIDHINGGGAKEIRDSANPTRYYTRILESLAAGEKKYQLLCANCNWIKRFENNEHRGW